MSELAVTLRDPAVGRSGEDGLGRDRAELSRLRPPAPGTVRGNRARTRAPDGDELAMRAVKVILAMLTGWGFSNDAAVQRVRAALPGFVTIEAGGGFGVALDLNESVELLLVTLAAGLKTPSAPPGARSTEQTTKERTA